MLKSYRNARVRFVGRTPWGRGIAAPVRDFLGTETGGAIVLLAAAVAALIWANSPWWESYESVWSTELSIQVGREGISMDLRHWVNEGLMTLFFLVVGLEAKREFDVGELRERRRLTIPVFATIAGVGLPVAIYIGINAGGDAAHGWGAAMSTDTAFALGMLALVAPGGTRLRVRLLTIAVVDDFLALLVIAIAYSDAISLVPLAIAAGLFGALYALRWAPSRWRIEAAALLAFGIWVSLHGSGVDPVIAGLAIGLVTSAYTPRRGSLERAIELTRSFREQPTRELAKTARRGVAAAISPNERLQHALHPWTSYVIVPLFALANIGVHVDRDLVESAVRSPVTLGIFFGYVVGKPAGIVGGAWVATRLGAQRRLSWPAIGGLGAVAGIGFTISLLISSIAFDGRALDEARLGVLAAAIVASLGAWAVFWRIRRLPAHVRAHQLSGAADELLDLSEDVDPERDHVRGPDDAPVTLVEYGDYQCQYCGEAEVVVRELLTSFDDDLRYVWRHLPLSDVHPNAQMAAEASEAAAAQGAFWEMHDTLFAHQDELGSGDLRNYAEELGLDVGRLSDDLTRRAHARRVADDVATADASGVAGTPSFFVNGRRHHGAYDTASLSAAVSAARARALAARHSHAAGV